MKTVIAIALAIGLSAPAHAQALPPTLKNVPTGIDVPGCTFYKLVRVDGRLTVEQICLPKDAARLDRGDAAWFAVAPQSNGNGGGGSGGGDSQ